LGALPAQRGHQPHSQQRPTPTTTTQRKHARDTISEGIDGKEADLFEEMGAAPGRPLLPF
jgi:hypothetical protein